MGGLSGLHNRQQYHHDDQPDQRLGFLPDDLSIDYGSAPGDDFDDFESVAGLELALRKLGRGDRFPVVLNDDATREKVLSGQELLE